MKRVYSIILIVGLILGVVNGWTQAQEAEPGTTAVVPGEPQGPHDPAEVEAFLDGVMVAHMESYHIAGAVIALVKDGKLFFAKGYGYANVEKKKPVIADKTLFRTGSTAKLFTWTAVMQLHEKGLIDLDTDINIYLNKFKIPETFPQPITMTHLLAHTPGFEERFTGIGAMTPEDIVPLGEYLARHMPARVRPPGQLTAYSNYGTALAGYIVEVVSGLPYEKYVEENIFKPLDMMNSTFVQPLPSYLAENMSVGYEYKNGQYEAKEFELLGSMAPAGSMSCTAVDIANFMIAHLGGGAYLEKRILNEETVKKMHTQLFTNDAKTTGNAHGFWEYHHNQLRIIEHGGDTVYFHTLLSLVPEKNIGFFVSYNTLPERNPRSALLKAFLNRYYPLPDAIELTTLPKDRDNEGLRRFTGSYRMARSSYTTYEKVTGLFPFLNISATKEGKLLARSRQWIQVQLLVFREVGGQDTLVFKEDQEGNITHLFLSSIPHSACIKLQGIHNPVFHYILLVICGLLFLSTWRWPFAALYRKLCRPKDKRGKGHELIWARLLAGIMSTLYVLTFIGLIIVFSDAVGLLFGSAVPFLKILLAIPLLAVLLTFATLFFTILAWVKKYWNPCERIHYTLVALASLAFIWFLNYWNLLGFKI
ncbi:MAG: serine hydrolase domain-containing protein [Candidatus Aminicenantes bacterium]|jgi:CubicO group peptidase (beta-lactamase class C family)